MDIYTQGGSMCVACEDAFPIALLFHDFNAEVFYVLL